MRAIFKKSHNVTDIDPEQGIRAGNKTYIRVDPIMVDTSEPRISYLSKKSNILSGLTLYPALIVTKGFSPSQRFIRKEYICNSFEKKNSLGLVSIIFTVGLCFCMTSVLN